MGILLYLVCFSYAMAYTMNPVFFVVSYILQLHVYHGLKNVPYVFLLYITAMPRPIFIMFLFCILQLCHGLYNVPGVLAGA